MSNQAKTMGGEAAFPLDEHGGSMVNEQGVTCYQHEAHFGLTKREYFAGLAMQGLLAATAAHPDIYADETSEITASAAVARADALLSALAKESDQ